ncbi:hypothetical protein [Methylobacterium aerolatum]|uniref:Uncharacterized protein n=1 Tax=Methylobacterium aerolatum TaxID=418708 RepID=A0ABU0I4P0_9HYPH|nr:hypothetical protein [Methylobacterium aerolatum]MDQ0449052.1 hypothetical protein [Methylobacterium aerolatum]GJD35240.1 hypothetical protein FMGBMHLM_2149 [Methylobacterium aerolatum]
MIRITPVGSVRTERVIDGRAADRAAASPTPPSRALTVIGGGRAETDDRSTAWLRDGRTEAGFVTQLLVGADPTLQTSRLARTRQAAASYATMARRLA